jgi:hypothetical protein
VRVTEIDGDVTSPRRNISRCTVAFSVEIRYHSVQSCHTIHLRTRQSHRLNSNGSRHGRTAVRPHQSRAAAVSAAGDAVNGRERPQSAWPLHALDTGAESKLLQPVQAYEFYRYVEHVRRRIYYRCVQVTEEWQNHAVCFRGRRGHSDDAILASSDFKKLPEAVADARAVAAVISSYQKFDM